MKILVSLLLLLIFNNTVYAYNRDDYGSGWWYNVKTHCDIRKEILIERSIEPTTIQKPCKIISGKWKSFYSEEIINDSSTIDLDHLVAVKEIDDLCGSALSSDQKRMFYNDKENLVIATQKENRSKGARTTSAFKTKDIENQYNSIRKKIIYKYCKINI